MKNIFLASLLSFISTVSYSQCIKGNCHRGHGTFLWEDKNKYEGFWIDGKANGFGDLRYQNGDKYKGGFIDGKKDGTGKYTWKNGNSYNGSWSKDAMNGDGEYVWIKENAKYEGSFKDGKIENVEIGITIETPEKSSQ